MSITTEIRQDLPTGTWQLDPVHSSVGFEIPYLGGTFRGQFREVAGGLVVDENGARLFGSAPVAGIEVKDENLNAHLLAPDFFDAERHPTLRFDAADVRRSGDDVIVDGEITIKGVTRPIELAGRIGDPVDHPAGGCRLGLRLEATIDRTDFGLNWNMLLPDGGPALGNEVRLVAELFFAQEA